MQPSVYGYLSMLMDSFAIDAFYSLNNRNLLAAILAHGAVIPIVTFFFPPPSMRYLLVIKLLMVGFPRYQVHLKSEGSLRATVSQYNVKSASTL